MKLIKHETYIKELLEKNARFREEYEKWDPAFEIGQMLVEARVIKGLTQVRLAEMINTKQQSVSRAENGKHIPSLNFLVKIAKALGTYLIVRFGFMETYRVSYKISAAHTDTKEDVRGISEGWLQSEPAFLSLRATRSFATA